MSTLPQCALVLNPDRTVSYYTSAQTVCFNLVYFLRETVHVAAVLHLSGTLSTA